MRQGLAHTLSEQLALRMHSLAPQLLRNGSYGPGKRLWRVGSLSGEEGQSLCVWLDGPRKGRWKDYASGERGDALDLVAQILCHGDLGDACKWAKQWLGLGDLDDGDYQRLKRESERAQQERQAEADKLARKQQADAKKIWLAGEELRPGDAAWRYLAGRAIDLAKLPSVPRALRCHAALYNAESQQSWPALVAAICDPQGKTVNCHRIWLEEKADGRVTKAPLKDAKLSMKGGYAGGCVRLWKGASNLAWRDMGPGEVLLAGEGIEDTLSGVLFKPEWRACATLSVSGLEGLVLPANVVRLVWIAQNDPRGSSASKALARAYSVHRAQGRDVASLRPPVCFKDLNEHLQWLGTQPPELHEQDAA